MAPILQKATAENTETAETAETAENGLKPAVPPANTAANTAVAGNAKPRNAAAPSANAPAPAANAAAPAPAAPAPVAPAPIPVRLLHESDVDTWGGPDRVYYEFVIISVLLGLVGGDHIYLRSFKTACLKALVNLFTFGSWYWWDLIQIFTNGNTVKSEGLSSPLDWIRNIGRGVFVDKAKDPTEYVSKKSYIVFALCAVFLGFFAGDKFYMGDYVSGIAKAVLCLNIFTFLIGWVWAAYDAWNAVFSEQDILDHGIPAAPGIGWMFPKVSSEAFKLRPKREGDDAIVASVLGTVGLSEDSGLGPWIRWILCLLGLSSGSKQSCEKPTYRAPAAAVAPTTAEASKGTVVNKAKKTTNATNATNTAKAPEPISTAEEPRTQAAPSQRGGSRDEVRDEIRGRDEIRDEVRSRDEIRGRDDDVGSLTSNEMSGPGPVVAGALTAVVIAAGLKSTYEFISQQYQ